MKVKTKSQILRMYKKAVKSDIDSEERYSVRTNVRVKTLEDVLGLTDSEIRKIYLDVMKEVGFHPSRIK